jgi:hypothetical protein
LAKSSNNRVLIKAYSVVATSLLFIICWTHQTWLLKIDIAYNYEYIYKVTCWACQTLGFLASRQAYHMITNGALTFMALAKTDRVMTCQPNGPFGLSLPNWKAVSNLVPPWITFI